MKKIWLIICISLFLIQPCFAQIDTHLENYYKLQESAVQLIIYFTDTEDIGVCSGIIITEDENSTGILTAKHCVPSNVKKILINNQYKVVKYATTKDIDVAYMEINTSLIRYNPIKISKFNANKYSRVYFLGYPSSKEVFEVGIVYLSGVVVELVLLIKEEN